MRYLFSSRLPAVAPCPGFRSSARVSCWRWPTTNGFRRWPFKCNVIRPPCGVSVDAMNRPGWRAYWRMRRARGTRWKFPPLQRAQIVALACREPIATGIHISHWTSQDLARQAMAEGIEPFLSARSVRRILQEVDLQPHRTRYWKTAHLDARFKPRAEKILWCYANAERLVARGFWVVCSDEIPNLQALERQPIRRAIPGAIEQQEFEYVRHGTVNVLLCLIVHSGRMEAACLVRKNADHDLQALQRFRQRHRHLRGGFLIQDGDPSHTATATRVYFKRPPWWRPRFT